MLSREQKENLRNIHIYDLSTEEKNGIAIIRETIPTAKGAKKKFNTIEKEFIIPTPYQLVENMSTKILASGFSKVERVAPSNANCIIRVFQKLHYKHEFDQIFNIYGASCFTKDTMGWISNSDCGECYTLNPSRCLIGQWLYQDEKITFDADFIDFYVKVS